MLRQYGASFRRSAPLFVISGVPSPDYVAVSV